MISVTVPFRPLLVKAAFRFKIYIGFVYAREGEIIEKDSEDGKRYPFTGKKRRFHIYQD